MGPGSELFCSGPCDAEAIVVKLNQLLRGADLGLMPICRCRPWCRRRVHKALSIGAWALAATVLHSNRCQPLPSTATTRKEACSSARTLPPAATPDLAHNLLPLAVGWGLRRHEVDPGVPSSRVVTHRCLLSSHAPSKSLPTRTSR